MLKEINLEQNTDAWLDWRKTGIGSSDTPAVLNMSPWSSREELWEQKVLQYHKDKKILSAKQMEIICDKMRKKEFQNESAKNRGKKLEEPCRLKYEKFMGYEVPAVCGSHSDYDFLKVSLDGYNKDRNLFVEIKCPNNKSHDLAISGVVPDYYVPQLLHQFIVSDAEECHYISYHDKYPPGQDFVIVQVNKNTVHKAFALNNTLEYMKEYTKKELIRFWESVVNHTYVD